MVRHYLTHVMLLRPRFNLTQAVALTKHGQDVAAAFFACGAANPACWSDSISLCPLGSDTSTQVCRPANP